MLPRLLLAAVWSDDGGPGLHRGIAIRREVERRLKLFQEGRWAELLPAPGAARLPQPTTDEQNRAAAV
eukprot:11455355-Alexandrium_andersonii.AAC.1